MAFIIDNPTAPMALVMVTSSMRTCLKKLCKKKGLDRASLPVPLDRDGAMKFLTNACEGDRALLDILNSTVVEAVGGTPDNKDRSIFEMMKREVREECGASRNDDGGTLSPEELIMHPGAYETLNHVFSGILRGGVRPNTTVVGASGFPISIYHAVLTTSEARVLDSAIRAKAEALGEINAETLRMERFHVLQLVGHPLFEQANLAGIATMAPAEKMALVSRLVREHPVVLESGQPAQLRNFNFFYWVAKVYEIWGVPLIEAGVAKGEDLERWKAQMRGRVPLGGAFSPALGHRARRGGGGD